MDHAVDRGAEDTRGTVLPTVCMIPVYDTILIEKRVVWYAGLYAGIRKWYAKIIHITYNK